MLDSFDLCHIRLEHTNKSKMHVITETSSIPYIDSKKNKGKTCLVTKITQNSLLKIERNSKLLELIHSDVGNMHIVHPLLEVRNFTSVL